MNSWKKMIEDLTAEFMNWGCPFSRKRLPEIAMTYDCTPLFFWNWQDGEIEKTEKSFLRVLGYAWKKYLETEAEPIARPAVARINPAAADTAAA